MNAAYKVEVAHVFEEQGPGGSLKGTVKFKDGENFNFQITTYGKRTRVRLLSPVHNIPTSCPPRLESLLAWLHANHPSAMRTAEEQRVIDESAALAEGKFWTVQIAYFPEHATAQIVKGQMTKDTMVNFRVSNPGAHMFLDPRVVLGDRLHVRQQVCGLADTDILFIYVIGDDRDAKKVDMSKLPLADGGTFGSEAA